MVDLIDKNGYRANVGIVLMNQQKELFFAKRRYQSGWQFPQGGIHIGETPESAMYRELLEETGLTKMTLSSCLNPTTGINIKFQKNTYEH